MRGDHVEFTPSPTPPPGTKNTPKNDGPNPVRVAPGALEQGKMVTSTCNRSLRHVKKPMLFSRFWRPLTCGKQGHVAENGFLFMSEVTWAEPARIMRAPGGTRAHNARARRRPVTFRCNRSPETGYIGMQLIAAGLAAEAEPYNIYI